MREIFLPDSLAEADARYVELEAEAYAYFNNANEDWELDLDFEDLDAMAHEYADKVLRRLAVHGAP